MRLKRRKPDYDDIARLERDLGMGFAPTDDLGGEIEQARMDALEARRKDSPSGPVLLEKRTHPLHAIFDPSTLVLSPGQKWPVADPEDVRPFGPVSSYCATAVYGHSPFTVGRPSRVVLPPGVTA